MNNDYLDEKLNTATREAEKFFSKNIDSERLRKNINLRIMCKKSDKKQYFSSVFGKASMACVCVLFILIIPLVSKNIFFNTNKNDILGEPIIQQAIKLDEKAEQWLNYFKIDKPDKKQSNLLAVLWNGNMRGDYEVVYSSVLENSDKPLPASIINFPDKKHSMALISSENNKDNYIHYRVIGYKNNEVYAYLEQDYVIGGEIEIIDNIIHEKRIAPSEYNEEEGDKSAKQVKTYYIPYSYNEFGNLILATNNLRVRKGEQIVLFGSHERPEFTYSSEIFAEQEKENKGKNELSQYLYAIHTGVDNIYVRPKEGTESQKLSVEVIDGNLIEY